MDGDSHFTVEAKQYDEERTAYMKQFGIEVVRVTNLETIEGGRSNAGGLPPPHPLL